MNQNKEGGGVMVFRHQQKPRRDGRVSLDVIIGGNLVALASSWVKSKSVSRAKWGNFEELQIPMRDIARGMVR